jgi:uncharacterized protein YbaA (DUF1428 family)
LEYVIRFFVFVKAIRHAEDYVMTKEIETTKPHEQTKQTTMTHYVDGFVIPLPKNKIDDYRRIAEKSGEVWRDHGALEYRECIGEDLNVKGRLPFPLLIDCHADETVVFAWIVFESRAHRDEVNARVMKDPRLAKLDPEAMPFDCKRMAYGGFEVLVDAFAAVTTELSVLNRGRFQTCNPLTSTNRHEILASAAVARLPSSRSPELPWVFSEAFPSDEARVAIRACAGSLSD